MTNRRAILAIAAVVLSCSLALCCCDASSVAAGAAHTLSLSSLRTHGVSVWETAEKTRGTKRQKLEQIPIRATRVRMEEDQELKQAKKDNGTSTLYIDPLTIYQSILGFGGAITEASVTVLNQLPKEKIEEVIQAYYGADGSRYSVARMHINSCDFSVNSWNFDNATDDFNLTSFDRQLTHEQTFMIPFVTEVLQKSFHPMKIFGSPWSPPAWMKTNDNMLSSASPCLKNDSRYHQAWADYLSLTIKTYESFGVPFWGMTVQNEPEYAAPWEACTYTAEEEADFISNYLGPVFAKDHPQLEIIAYDHNKDHVKIWADTIFSKVSQFVDWIGVHWYSGDGFDHLNQTHQAWPKKHILATEATNVDGPRFGDVSRGEAYAHDIIGDLNNFVSGWTDWNIVLDMRGGPNHLKNWCDAAIIADIDNGTLIYQPMYDYLWHFSRFLPPGERSFRVAHSLDSEDPNVQNLEMVAFAVQNSDRHQKKKQHSHKGDSHHGNNKSEGSSSDIVLIVMNAQDVDVQFNVALSGNKHEFLVDMPAHSIKTLSFDQQLLM